MNNTKNTNSGFTPSQLKHFSKISTNPFGDIVHPDGSKSYGNIRGGYVTIKRPYVVAFIESILKIGYRGYGYMPVLDLNLEMGNITGEEYNQIMLILD
jgi:hypothetical protein